MKTIKLILATLLMMVAFTVQAQEYVVQVYKDGAVVKEYPASEVKDVQVKPVYGYYGWINSNSAKNDTEIAASKFTNKLSSDLPLVLTDTSKFTGNYFIIALANSAKPNASFESTLGNAPLKIQTGAEWEVNNTVNINNEEFYVFIITTPIGATTTKLTISKIN